MILEEKTKKIIESIVRNYLIENEYIDEMAYPTSFNMDEFKSLRTYAERFRYCKERLEYISSGSSRYVFGIDNDKVLKLAKNQKGVVQNDSEIDAARYSEIVGEVYDFDDNYLWLEMERVNKITPTKFKSILGIDFKEYCQFLEYFHTQNNPSKYKFRHISKPEQWDTLWDEENKLTDFINAAFDLIATLDMLPGDLMRLNTYGVTANGEIKVVDAGLTNSVWDSEYKR